MDRIKVGTPYRYGRPRFSIYEYSEPDREIGCTGVMVWLPGVTEIAFGADIESLRDLHKALGEYIQQRERKNAVENATKGVA